MSGGIRDDEPLEAAMATGCRQVNIGTAALEQPEWCAKRRDVRRPGGGGPSTSACARWLPVRVDQDGGDLYETPPA